MWAVSGAQLGGPVVPTRLPSRASPLLLASWPLPQSAHSIQGISGGSGTPVRWGRGGGQAGWQHCLFCPLNPGCCFCTLRPHSLGGEGERPAEAALFFTTDSCVPTGGSLACSHSDLPQASGRVRGWWPVPGRGKGELFHGCRVSVLQDEKVLALDVGEVRTTV